MLPKKPDYTFRSWSKYGKKRIYCNHTETGQTLGWIDYTSRPYLEANPKLAVPLKMTILEILTAKYEEIKTHLKRISDPQYLYVDEHSSYNASDESIRYNMDRPSYAGGYGTL